MIHTLRSTMVLPAIAFALGALFGYFRGIGAEHEITMALNREFGGACGSHLGVTRGFYASGFAMLAGWLMVLAQALVRRGTHERHEGGPRNPPLQPTRQTAPRG